MPVPDQLNRIFAAARPPLPDKRDLARERLIVALDVPSAAAAEVLLNRLDGTCQWFKVGLELFTAAGPAVLEPLAARGHSVFLDLKFHDIPNTVAGAVRSAAAWGVRMITIHAAGGPAMLAAARNALQGIANPPELLAVTVLTSMDSAQLESTGVARSPADQVNLLAKTALDAGIRGFVCSPQEVSALRALIGPDGIIVVPGIRPAGSDTTVGANTAAGSNTDDQKRIATPAQALSAGASFLVVGRPITQAPDPAQAAEAIFQEMAEAL
jgi:orotidine-5'-phosphate decarboxylase